MRVRIRLTPRAAANRIAGLAAEADGGLSLKVMVTAPAEAGKANAALLALLSEAWAVPKRDLAIVLGAGNRRKTIHVSGDPAVLSARLTGHLAASRG